MSKDAHIADALIVAQLREATRVSPVIGGFDTTAPTDEPSFWKNPKAKRVASAFGAGIQTSRSSELVSRYNFDTSKERVPAHIERRQIHAYTLRRMVKHGILRKAGERYVPGQQWAAHNDVFQATGDTSKRHGVTVHDVAQHSIMGVRGDPVGETKARHLLTVMRHVRAHGEITPADHRGLHRLVSVDEAPGTQRYVLNPASRTATGRDEFGE